MEPLQIALGIPSLRFVLGAQLLVDTFPQSADVVHRVVNISC
jgi:hypothetical protein